MDPFIWIWISMGIWNTPHLGRMHVDGFKEFLPPGKKTQKLWSCGVVVSTHLKNMLVKLDHFPRVRDENKYLSCGKKRIF